MKNQVSKQFVNQAMVGNIKRSMYFLVVLLMLSPGSVWASTHSFQGVKIKLPTDAKLTWIVRDGQVNGQDASVAILDLPGTLETVSSYFENLLFNYGKFRKSEESSGVLLYQRRDKWFLSVQVTKSDTVIRTNIMVTEFDSRKLDKSLTAFNVPSTFEVVQVNRDSVSENASLISKRPVEVSTQQLHRALVASGWKRSSVKKLSEIYGSQLQYKKRNKTMEVLVLSNALGDYASAAYVNIPN